MLRPSDVRSIRISLRPTAAAPEFLAAAEATVGPVRVNGLRIVSLPDGRIAVKFPDRPATRACPGCTCPVAVFHRFCSFCGASLPALSAEEMTHGRAYRVVAQPTALADRIVVETEVLHAYLRAIGCRPATLPMSLPATARAERGGAA